MFTFGLGSGCDQRLVTNVAKAGRGSYTFVQDGGEDLNGQVVRALSLAMQPSLKDACYGWNISDIEDEPKIEDIYRNTLIYKTKLISASDLPTVQFWFRADEDSDEARDPIDLSFSRADFKMIDGPAGQALFKLAVFNWLEDKETGANGDQRIEVSLKHQVLCDDTAIIGVCK